MDNLAESAETNEFYPGRDHAAESYIRACLCDWRYTDVSAAELNRLVNVTSVGKSSEDIVPVAFVSLNQRVGESRYSQKQSNEK